MKKKAFLILISLFSIFLASFKPNASTDYEDEAIFLKLRNELLLSKKPKKIQRDKFAVAEYYFKHNDFSDAFSNFSDFAKTYPPDESTLLAKIYLYKIAVIKKDSNLASSLKKEIFDSPFILLFSNYKMLKYKSAFDNVYEIHYYLDKIQVFLNGEAFVEITP